MDANQTVIDKSLKNTGCILYTQRHGPGPLLHPRASCVLALKHHAASQAKC